MKLRLKLRFKQNKLKLKPKRLELTNLKMKLKTKRKMKLKMEMEVEGRPCNQKGPSLQISMKWQEKSHQRIKITTEEDLIWFPNCRQGRECGSFYKDVGFPLVLGCRSDPAFGHCAVSLLLYANTEGVIHIPYIHWIRMLKILNKNLVWIVPFFSRQ